MDLGKALAPLAERLDSKIGWPRVKPYYLGLATLVGLRARMRERNVYGTPVPEPSEEQRLAAGRAQLPPATVVTPWLREGVAYGSQNSWAS